VLFRSVTLKGTDFYTITDEFGVFVMYVDSYYFSDGIELELNHYAYHPRAILVAKDFDDLKIDLQPIEHLPVIAADKPAPPTLMAGAVIISGKLARRQKRKRFWRSLKFWKRS
jgi:hypothetical protein